MAKKFYAQTDKLGFPIPGTLQSTPYGKLPSGTIEIPAADTVVGGGTQVIQPGKLRYFVAKDQGGNIIPNSLIISKIKPSRAVYEFILVK
jgi:hypothetical protein